MASPFGSTTALAETEPVIDGGVYEFEHKDADGEVAAIERGTVMGTWTDLASGRVQGNLYHYRRGSQPFRITEGTASFSQWKLVSAPTKGAAKSAKATYKARLAAEEAELAEAKLAARRTG
jgi:hypothetical protein